jgi:hypothetical protein
MIPDSDSFMDMINTILHSPRMDMALPPLPPNFKAMANALTSRPASAAGMVIGIPSSHPNSARSAMIEGTRTSDIMIISPRMLDGCMSFDITDLVRMPSERIAFL